MSFLFHGLAPPIEFGIFKIHTIALCPPIWRLTVDNGTGRNFQSIIRKAMKFTALHRQYPPLYIGYVFLYIIPPVGYTDSGIGMIEHAVIRSHETYPAQFSHRIGCVILGFIGFPCLVIGFPCDCFRIRSIGLSAYLSDRG